MNKCLSSGIIFFTIGLTGFFSVLMLTAKMGVGIPSDACFYIRMARCMNGLDLCTDSYLTENLLWQHFPPLFPIVLAFIHLFGRPDFLIEARWVNALLFGLNIFLVGKLVYKYSGSLWLSAVGALWMIVKIDVIDVHTEAMSEPLFIFLALLWMVFLIDYLETRKAVFLWACAIAAGLSFLTRFFGVSLVLTGFVILWADKKNEMLKSSIAAVLFFFVSIFPMMLLLIKNYVDSGSLVDRRFYFDPFAIADLHSCSWPLNPWHGSVIVFGLNIGLVLMGWMIWQKRDPSAIRNISTVKVQLFSTGLIFIVFYFLFWLMDLILADPLAVTQRYYIPVEILGLILLLSFLGTLLNVANISRPIKTLFVVLLSVYLIGMNFVGAMPWAVERHGEGTDFDKKIWVDSEIIRAVKKMPSQMVIYTNIFSALYIHAKRNSIPLVELTQFNIFSSPYMDRMKREMIAGKGIIVYSPFVKRKEFASIEELQHRMPLRMLFKVSDGEVYVWDDRTVTRHPK